MNTIKIDPVDHLATERSDFTSHELTKIVVEGEELTVVKPVNFHVVIPEEFDSTYLTYLEEWWSTFQEENPRLPPAACEVSFTGLKEGPPPNAINFLDAVRFFSEAGVKARTVNAANRVLLSEAFGTPVLKALSEEDSLYNLNCSSESYSMEEVGKISQLCKYAGGSARLSTVSSKLEEKELVALLDEARAAAVDSVIVREDSSSFEALKEAFRFYCTPLYEKTGVEYSVEVLIWRDKVVKFYTDLPHPASPVVVAPPPG